MPQRFALLYRRQKVRTPTPWARVQKGCDEGEVVQEPIKLRDRMPSISPKSRSYKGGNTGD
jgi:hypothetical protein